MNSPGDSTVRDAEEHVVPAELMRELHAANEQFHHSKQQLEQVMSDSEEQHQDRMDRATQQVRLAERRVEEINGKIHESLKPPPVTPPIGPVPVASAPVVSAPVR